MTRIISPHSTYKTIDTTVSGTEGRYFFRRRTYRNELMLWKKIGQSVWKQTEGVFIMLNFFWPTETNDFGNKIDWQTEKKFPVINFGNSDNVAKRTAGICNRNSPLGFEYTISSGIITAVRD